MGRAWALGAILAGVFVSGLIAPPELVLASAVSFGLSELADAAVYTPLERRGLEIAVLFSSAVGLVVDSVLFLLFAFGSLQHLEGQVLGKAAMVVLSLPLVRWLRTLEPVGAVP